MSLCNYARTTTPTNENKNQTTTSSTTAPPPPAPPPPPPPPNPPCSRKVEVVLHPDRIGSFLVGQQTDQYADQAHRNDHGEEVEEDVQGLAVPERVEGRGKR